MIHLPGNRWFLMEDEPFIDIAESEDDLMPRAIDSNVPVAPDDRSDPARAIADSIASKHVCPFCGSQNAESAKGKSGSACPRCTMEDTAATRQATKARIGPWHVLQTRNPAAPGMRYATLLALVSKGQITPRSVVRGPTTHQLWRYAAHVRGVSREFGVCYSCSEAIEKTASHCIHCDRSQDPTGNPDSLLEVRDASIAPPPPQSVPMSVQIPVPMPVPMPINGSAVSSGVPAQISRREELPESYAPVLATTRAVSSHAERIRAAAAEPRRRGDGRVLSAMDLAAALQTSPSVEAAKETHPVRTVLITIVIVAIIGSGIVSYARPDLRRQATDWAQTNFGPIANKIESFHLKPSPSDQPATAVVPTPLPSVTPSPAPSDNPETPAATSPPPVLPTAPMVAVDPPPAPAPTVEITPAPTPAPANVAVTPMPEIVPDAKPSLAQPDHPVLVGPSLSTKDIWALRKKGLDAESNRDYAAAIQCYEQIEQCPHDQWPADIKIRLEIARREWGH